MSNLTLNIIDDCKISPCVFVNNKLVKFKKFKGTNNKANLWQANISNLQGEIELSFKKKNSIQSKLWLLDWLVYFIFGIFGIFAPRNDKRAINLDYTAKFNCQDKEQIKLDVIINNSNNKKQAVEISGDTQIDMPTENNLFTINQLELKRLKKIKTLNILSFLIIVVCLFLFL